MGSVEAGDWEAAAKAGLVGKRRPGHRLVVVKLRKSGRAHIRWDDGAEVEFEARTEEHRAEVADLVARVELGALRRKLGLE